MLMILALVTGASSGVMMADATNLPDAGKTAAGADGGDGGTGGIATESQGREDGDPNFYLTDVDKRIVKIRPMATPIDQISRYAKSSETSSFEVKYYSVGTREIKCSTNKAVTAMTSGASVSLPVDDLNMFTLDDTIRVVGVKAITKSDGTKWTDEDSNVPDLVLCVCGKDSTTNLPTVYAVNGNIDTSTKQPILVPTIPQGTTLVRMGKACGELDVQTGRFNNIPMPETQYCQNFMIQVEQTTFDKIAAKRVDWDFSDIEEDSIYDMRLAMEGTYLFGDMACIKHEIKDGSAQWFTKGIWWMAGKDIEVGHVATADDIKKGYNKNERVITDLELVDISKDLFVGTGIGNKRKVIIAGSDFVSAFSKIDSDKFRLKDTVDIWKLKFKSWETDFGEVLMIHSELFDLFGMSDCGFALDPEFLVKRVHLSWTRNVLDLKAAGIRNTDAVVIQEVACLYLKYPKAHARMRLAAVPATDGTSDTEETKATV